MRFKKIYVEVTNKCNLNCSFCAGNNREKKFINISDFDKVLNKVKGFTKYLYFHLMGEPLMHPEINKLIDIAAKDFFINITTNGFFISRVKDNKNIRQINISLHDFSGPFLDKYLQSIFESVDSLLENNTYISFRMWTDSQYKSEIIKKINHYYGCNLSGENSEKIKEKLFYEVETAFEWPNLNNSYYDEHGTCRGLIDHLGILVDGTVVPCCLDSEGIIELGNIYKTDLSDIIATEKFMNIYSGFKANIKREELCKHCSFYEMRKNNKTN